MIRSVIFDFDGVIADSLDFVLGVANRYLLRWGKTPLDKGFLRSHDIEELYRHYGVNRLQELFLLLMIRRAIHKNLAVIPVHKHIVPVIKNTSQKTALSVLTSNSKTNVLDFLKTHHVHNYFLEIHGNFLMFDKERGLKSILANKGLEPKETVYIGDEPRDIRAARKVGVGALAVDWGYSARGLLADTRPDAIASTAEELTLALKSL